MGYLIEKYVKEGKISRTKGWWITAILDVIFIIAVLYLALIAKTDYELQIENNRLLKSCSILNPSILENFTQDISGNPSCGIQP